MSAAGLSGDEQLIKEALNNSAFLEKLSTEELDHLKTKMSAKKQLLEVDAPKWLQVLYRVFAVCVVGFVLACAGYALFRFIQAQDAHDLKRIAVLLMVGVCGVFCLWFCLAARAIAQQMYLLRGIKEKLRVFKGATDGSN